MRSQGEDLAGDRRRLLRLTRTLALSSCLCFAFGCSRRLSAGECNELLDHYTELLAHSKNSDLPDPEIERLQSEARKKAAEDPEFLRCSSKVSRSQWDCAMHAPSVDEVERCLL